jgi:KaiC/GvpD/RAD55 family RecA-like ATPase
MRAGAGGPQGLEVSALMDAASAGGPPPFPEDGQRLPPHSVEAEQSLIGSVLLDNTAYARVSDLINAGSFYGHEHRLIWAAVAVIVEAGHPADAVTVADWLRERDQDEAAGGVPYLTALTVAVPTAKHARRYAQIVADKFAERALIAALGEAVQASWEPAMDLRARFDRVQALLARAESATEGVRTRLPLLRLGQLRELAKGVRWTVKRVVPAASVGMMFGGSGTFKSFIALDLALHVAHGLPWMGQITRQADVLYIAAEGGAGLWARIDAWHRERRLKVDDASPLCVLPMALDLAQEAWRVVEAAQALGVTPGLVVVDTLSQTYAGEENSANEMAAYLRELGTRMRDLWQCSVMLVHHSGHAATERPRGSSAIRANLDYLLGVHRDEKEMLATLSCVKQKDGELFDDADFALTVVELGMDEDGDKVTSLVARHLSTKEEAERVRMAEVAAGRGGRNTAFVQLVAEHNGQDVRALRKAFYELLEGVDAEAKKKAFLRAKSWAEAQGYMEVVEGLVVLHRGLQ